MMNISGKEHLVFWTIMNEMVAYLPASKTKTTKLQRSLNNHNIQNFDCDRRNSSDSFCRWNLSISYISQYYDICNCYIKEQNEYSNCMGLVTITEFQNINMILNPIKEVQPNIKAFPINGQQSRSNDDPFHGAHHHFCAWHISQKIKNQILKDAYWKHLKAEHPIQFDFELTKLLKELPNESKVLKVVQFTNFCRFAEKILLNGTVVSSHVGLINNEINSLPNEVFEYLELIDFDRCIALRSLQTPITLYYEQCKSQIVKMVSDLVVCNSGQQDLTGVIIDTKVNESSTGIFPMKKISR